MLWIVLAFIAWVLILPVWSADVRLQGTEAMVLGAIQVIYIKSILPEDFILISLEKPLVLMTIPWTRTTTHVIISHPLLGLCIWALMRFGAPKSSPCLFRKPICICMYSNAQKNQTFILAKIKLLFKTKGRPEFVTSFFKIQHFQPHFTIHSG